jgi:hypothetical protein
MRQSIHTRDLLVGLGNVQGHLVNVRCDATRALRLMPGAYAGAAMPCGGAEFATQRCSEPSATTPVQRKRLTAASPRSLWRPTRRWPEFSRIG